MGNLKHGVGDSIYYLSTKAEETFRCLHEFSPHKNMCSGWLKLKAKVASQLVSIEDFMHLLVPIYRGLIETPTSTNEKSHTCRTTVYCEM